MKLVSHLRRIVEFSKEIIERLNEFLDGKRRGEWGKVANVGEQNTHVFVFFDE